MRKTQPAHSLRALFHAAVELLFPPRCAGCGRPGHQFCHVCSQAVLPVPRPLCQRCGRPQIFSVARCVRCQDEAASPLQMIRAAALHTHPLRPAIHEFKYESRVELADLLARYLVAVYAHPEWQTLQLSIDGVSPVPLHAERLTSRGYNQSELLARAFCQRTGLRLRPDWIQRQRDTRPQVGLNANERRVNVADAFVASDEVDGRSLLLIDDVFTTGATLTACAMAAHKSGASAVYALTLAMPASGNLSPDDDVVAA